MKRDHAALLRAVGAERWPLDRLCLDDEAPLACEMEWVRAALGRVEWRSSVRPIGHAKLDLGPNPAPVAFTIRLSGRPDGMAGDEERSEPMAGDESVRVGHDWAVKGHEE